jgi:hypothetical protein
VEPKLYQTLEFWRSNWHFISGDYQISIFIEYAIRTKEACQPLKRHIVQGEGGDQETWSWDPLLTSGFTTGANNRLHIPLILQANYSECPDPSPEIHYKTLS